ncbi:FAD-dependent monooxygenase terC [Paramyrothecium foliicola]|nr:FAD-dependent monooxygenase terC [Paramyrothecium foliicola]
MPNPFAIIVGAGPSGMLLALLLAKAGLQVRLLEASDALSDEPKATHYGPGALDEIERAGVLADLQERGMPTNGVAWRKPDGSRSVFLRTEKLRGDYKHDMVCLPQNLFNPLLMEHVEKQPDIKVSWQHKVIDVGQDEGEAWVEVECPDGRKKLSATYLIGCDGASSQVRRSLFGEEFPGWTWTERVISTTTYYPFEKYGFVDNNFIVHPDHWYMAAKICRDGLWKITYGEIPGLTREQYLERQPEKFRVMLPGNPTPDQWRTTNFSPYKVHQRLAKSLRVGRIMLAGDAGHRRFSVLCRPQQVLEEIAQSLTENQLVCSPFGGLGLTGGIADVGGLYDCLVGIATGKADESILDRYNEIRSKIWRDFTDVGSTSNMRRLCQTDPETIFDTDPFLLAAAKMDEDPKLAARIGKGAFAITHDFTQYYKQGVEAVV